MRVEPGIRRLPNGSHEVRVHLPRDPATGVQRQVSRIVHTGIRAARAKRAELMVEVGKGKHGRESRTLGDLFDAWNAHRQRIGRSPRTLAEDRRKIDTAIRPALGGIQLTKLRPKHLDDFYGAELARVAAGTERTISARTVLHEHRIIHAALEQAVRWEWMDRNVADSVEPPDVRPREETVPTPEEVQALIKEAGKSRAKEMAGVITVAALTGLREGELSGLRLCDVDWDAETLTVRQAVWQTTGTWGTKAPKSRKAKPEPLPVAELAMAVLRYRKEQLEKAVATVGVSLPPTTYVWSLDPLGQTPLKPSTISQAFRRIRNRAGQPTRFHDLRHYAASEMIANGADPRTVADLMRHSDPSFTLRTYVKGRTAQRSLAVQGLNASLERKTK